MSGFIITTKIENRRGRTVKIYYGGAEGKTGRAASVAKHNAPVLSKEQAETILSQLEKIDNRGWTIEDVYV